MADITLDGRWIAYYHGFEAAEYYTWVTWWNRQVFNYYAQVKHKLNYLNYEEKLAQYIRCAYFFLSTGIFLGPGVLVFLGYTVILNQGWTDPILKRASRDDRNFWFFPIARVFKIPLTKEEHFWARIKRTHYEVQRSYMLRDRHEQRRRRRNQR